jgi:hypothetical protein
VTAVAGANTLKDKTAVVGVGSTPYYKRGESMPQTAMQLAGKAVLAALDDAGLTVDDLALRRPTLDEIFLTLTEHDTTKELVP